MRATRSRRFDPTDLVEQQKEVIAMVPKHLRWLGRPLPESYR